MRNVNPTPAEKALWYIESRYSGEMRLDDIAQAAGVSRFHLSRAFAAATGHSVLRYVRGRRLTDAARALASGAPDILSVALDAGYNSHEAFTRAFRDFFGVTPEAVRAERRVDHLELTEPIRMKPNLVPQIEAPRLVEGKTFLFAGLNARYTGGNMAGIPSQWQRFAPHLGHVPGQVGHVTYGVVHNSDDEGNIDYLCAVEVGDFTDVPSELTPVRVPERKYAVFTHRGHIASISATFASIWNTYIPASGLEPADAPTLERYDERFDPITGAGEVEIWIPIRQ